MSDKTISLPRYLPIKWKSQWKICKHTEFNYALTIKVRWQRLIIIFIIECRVYFGSKYEIYDEFGVANAQCWVKSSYTNVYTSLTFCVTCFCSFLCEFSFFKLCQQNFIKFLISNFSRVCEFCKHHQITILIKWQIELQHAWIKWNSILFNVDKHLEVPLKWKCVSEKHTLVCLSGEKEEREAHEEYWRPKINFYCLLWSQNDENFSELPCVCFFSVDKIEAGEGMKRPMAHVQRWKKSSNIYFL